VLLRAEELLKRLEQLPSAKPKAQNLDLFAKSEQKIEVNPKEKLAIKQLKQTDVSRLTPLDALIKLAEIQQLLS
jgi:hypothetical protein